MSCSFLMYSVPALVGTRGHWHGVRKKGIYAKVYEISSFHFEANQYKE
jgi:hypothetical protein